MHAMLMHMHFNGREYTFDVVSRKTICIKSPRQQLVSHAQILFCTGSLSVGAYTTSDNILCTAI